MPQIVPGLLRGLEVLGLLEDGEAQSLDTLAVQTGFPKASLTRMLNTLIHLGHVEKDGSTRTYRALARLTPLAEDGESYTRRIDAALRDLSAETGTTAEWFVPEARGVVLTRRASPPAAEVRVLARVGFCRAWNEELDAVAMIAYALWPEAPAIAARPAFWHYDDAGGRVPLRKAAALARIAAVAPGQPIEDVELNNHGVLRLACGVLQSGALTGILALAMPFFPGFRKELPARRTALAGAARRLAGMKSM